MSSNSQRPGPPRSAPSVARSQAGPRPGAIPLLARAALLGAVWWVLTDGAPGSWLVGAPTVAAATWAAHRLGTGAGARLSPVGLLRFIPLFLSQSLRGGVDVALRTLGRCLRVDPGMGPYDTALSEPGARVLMANCVSLMPGTLAAGLEGRRLTFHALSMDSDNLGGLRQLEGAVARLLPQGSQGRR